MIRSNEIVYLSGPMSGLREDNRPYFCKMEKALQKQFPSAVILNPARHPRGLSYEQYMEYAKQDVDNCHCLVMLDDWHNSPGAQQERAHAVNIGRRIIRAELVNGKLVFNKRRTSNKGEPLD